MELEQIVELIDRVSASELDSFCLEQNGMRLSLKKRGLFSGKILFEKVIMFFLYRGMNGHGKIMKR